MAFDRNVSFIIADAFKAAEAQGYRPQTGATAMHELFAAAANRGVARKHGAENLILLAKPVNRTAGAIDWLCFFSTGDSAQAENYHVATLRTYRQNFADAR